MHTTQLMPLPLTVSCFSKIQIGFTFLVPAHLGSPEKRAVKQVCVCMYVCGSSGVDRAISQVRAPPGLDDPRDPDQDEGLSAGGGDDDASRRPDVPPGDEVPQQAGGVPDRLDHGQLASAQRAGRRLLHVQVATVCTRLTGVTDRPTDM